MWQTLCGMLLSLLHTKKIYQFSPPPHFCVQDVQFFQEPMSTFPPCHWDVYSSWGVMPQHFYAQDVQLPRSLLYISTLSLRFLPALHESCCFNQFSIILTMCRKCLKFPFGMINKYLAPYILSSHIQNRWMYSIFDGRNNLPYIHAWLEKLRKDCILYTTPSFCKI